ESLQAVQRGETTRHCRPFMRKSNQEYSGSVRIGKRGRDRPPQFHEIFSGRPEKRCVAGRCHGQIVPSLLASDRALQAAARFFKTVRLKRCSSPAWGGAPMSEQSISIPSTTVAAPAAATSSARPVAARTKLLLEGPVFATLLRLAAPNILNLVA